jgi:hypothetical protein
MQSISNNSFCINNSQVDAKLTNQTVVAVNNHHSPNSNSNNYNQNSDIHKNINTNGNSTLDDRILNDENLT